MADDPLDPNPALRSELEAALAILSPQIRGLHDFATPISISPELLNDFNDQIVSRERRRDLEQSVIATLDAVIVARRALAADGYPDLPNIELSPEMFAELQGQNADLDAAAGIFMARAKASKISADLGQPADKKRDP